MQKFIKQFLFIVGIFLSCDLNAQFVVDSLSAAYDNTDTAKVTINTNYACKQKTKSRLNIYFSIGALGDSIPTSFPVLTQTISPAPSSLSTGDLMIYLQNKPVWMTGKGSRIITSVNSPTTFSKDSLHKAYFKVKCVLTDACGHTSIRSKKGVFPPSTAPGILACTPCVFEPTVYGCVGGSGNSFYITNYDPLPMTFAGLPAIYKSSACSGTLNFKIRGIVNPVFPATAMVWSGPGVGSTLIGSQATSTCNGGLPAGQSNSYTVDTTGINVATLITATFNSGECGIQNISFYVLPDPPVITTTAVPVTGVPCPVVFPTTYNSICYADATALLNQVRVDYPAFTITYNSGPCTFSFTGSTTPPVGIPLVAYTLSYVAVPSSGVTVPLIFPVQFIGVSHFNSITLLSAVAAVYNSCPIRLISLNETAGIFTFEKDIASILPANIPLVQDPYTTSVPIVGLGCPLSFPLVYNATQYNNSGDFVSAVQALYPLHTITYNGLTCVFSFTGTTARPTSITVSAVPSGTVPVSGVACPVTFPVDYLATTYASEALLLAAVQADYPAFTITYDNISCLFTFTGIPARPTDIALTAYVPPTVCSAAINPIVTNNSGGSISIAWAHGNDPPVSYKLEVYFNSVLNQIITSPGITTTFTIGGVPNNGTFEFRIIARCGVGDTDNKAYASITVVTPPCGTPVGLTAGTITETTCPITWTANSPLPNDYRIRVYDVTGVTLLQTVTALAGATSATITGLTGETTYKIRLQARCAAANTDNSADAEITITTGTVGGCAQTVPMAFVYASSLVHNSGLDRLELTKPVTPAGSPVYYYSIFCTGATCSIYNDCTIGSQLYALPTGAGTFNIPLNISDPICVNPTVLTFTIIGFANTTEYNNYVATGVFGVACGRAFTVPAVAVP